MLNQAKDHLTLFDVENQQEIWSLRQPVTCVASLDEAIYVGQANGTLSVYEALSGYLLKEIPF